jgi:hypothetical protein
MIPLSPQQIRFFETFGYLSLPGLLANDTDTVVNKFDALFASNAPDILDWRHEAHYNNARHILIQLIERDPYLSALLEHPGIQGILTSLLGDNYLYRASEGNIFTGDTYWHSDLYNADFKYRHIKILFYLDPIDAQSGALRVIPGSHLFGDKFANQLERYVWEHDKNYGIDKESVPSITIPTRPGDAIVFDYRLKHATCHSGAHRRMFTICASERFRDEDMGSLQKMVEDLCKLSKGKIYQDDFVNLAPAERLKHLDQCLKSVEKQ